MPTREWANKLETAPSAQGWNNLLICKREMKSEKSNLQDSTALWMRTIVASKQSIERV
jgi:hypothetical protein